MSEQTQYPTSENLGSGERAPKQRKAFSRVRSQNPANAALMIIMPLIFIGTIGLFLYEAGMFEGLVTPDKSVPKPTTTSAKQPTVKTTEKTASQKLAKAQVQQAKPATKPNSPSIAAPSRAVLPGKPEASLDAFISDKIKMVAPKITRFDKKSRTYIVQAETAVRDKNQPDIVLLKKIKSEIRLPRNSQKIFVTANEGVYNKKTEELNLAGQIRVNTTNGYQATLSTAHIWLKGGHISSDQPVIIYMPQGSIAANGIEMLDGGATLRFLNRARMEINGNGR